jgi:hypothetical protein
MLAGTVASVPWTGGRSVYGSCFPGKGRGGESTTIQRVADMTLDVRNALDSVFRQQIDQGSEISH